MRVTLNLLYDAYKSIMLLNLFVVTTKTNRNKIKAFKVNIYGNYIWSSDNKSKGIWQLTNNEIKNTHHSAVANNIISSIPTNNSVDAKT